MKPFSPLWFAFVVVFALCPCAVSAKGKPKAHTPAPAAPQPVHPDSSNPKAALEPYVMNIDGLLALKTPAAKAALLSEAPGRLAVLRQEFIAHREKAPAEDKAKFTAAVNTCALLSAALDDRQKTLGDMRAANSVQGSSKLEEGPRKRNQTQGVHGGDRAKAVEGILERNREKQEAAAAEARASSADSAMAQMDENRWNKQAIDWRRRVAESYAAIQ